MGKKLAGLRRSQQVQKTQISQKSKIAQGREMKIL